MLTKLYNRFSVKGKAFFKWYTSVMFWFSILIGGAIGSGLRQLLSMLATNLFGLAFPWGTICVNSLGSLAVGFLCAWAGKIPLSTDTRAFIFIGVLGGFTTFSTYMLETLNLLRDREVKMALYNIFSQNILGLAMVIIGYLLAKQLFR
jgi:CrcB protein